MRGTSSPGAGEQAAGRFAEDSSSGAFEFIHDARRDPLWKTWRGEDTRSAEASLSSPAVGRRQETFSK